jgi:eukaryotic-like serine/threonine-protein kinase
MQTAESTLTAGFLLQAGRYRIEEVLGLGGFGVTYRAWDARLTMDVALKEFFPAGAYRDHDSVRFTGPQVGLDFQGALKDFLREAQLLAPLRHTNIVRLFDHFEELGTGFMVTEYLAGQTYSAVVETHGPLNETDAVAVIRAVGDGLMAVHKAGLVHRDVKPSNVMGTWEDGRVVLIDFGSSRVGASNVSAMASKSIVSDGYSPVEQYSGGAMTAASDVYALAATGYFLLTGSAPTSSLLRATGTPISELTTMNPTISAPVADALQQGLAFNIVDRPQSVEAFLELLRRPTLPATRPGALTTLIPGDQRTENVQGNTRVQQHNTTTATPWRRFVVPFVVLAVIGIGIEVLLRSKAHSNAESNVVTTVATVTESSNAPKPPDTSNAAASSTPPSATPAAPPLPMAKETVPAKLVMPDILGAEKASAVQALGTLGITPNLSTDYSATTPKGFVVRTNPGPGQAITANNTVDIVVSRGAPPTPAAPAAPKNTNTPPEPQATGRIVDEQGRTAADTFQEYYDRFNNGDYAGAYALESGDFANEVSVSQLSNWKVTNIDVQAVDCDGQPELSVCLGHVYFHLSSGKTSDEHTRVTMRIVDGQWTFNRYAVRSAVRR